MHFRAFHNAFVIFTLCACLFIIIILFFFIFFGWGKFIYLRSRIFFTFGAVERSNEGLTSA